MRIAPVDVTHKTFSKKVMGLDPQEVYEFLRDVADQMEEIVRERNRLKEDIVKKEQQMTEYVERDQALRATIQAASKMSDQFRQDAGKEAELIVADARQRGEVLVKDARDSLKKMYMEIADLKKTRLQFETNLRAMMQAHLTMLEQSRKVFPDAQVNEKAMAAAEEGADDFSMHPTIIGNA